MSKQRPIKLKIDVSKILKEHLYKGSKGTYLDCVVWPNKDGSGQYGDTHYIIQDLSREARDAGERGPIIGNATVPEQQQEQTAQRQNNQRPQQARPQRLQQGSPSQQDDFVSGPISDGMGDDDIPF